MADDAQKERARRAAQHFARHLLPTVAFDDPDLFFELAARRHDQALLQMVRRIDPGARVPGHARFLGRFALSGGAWRHLTTNADPEPHEWEAVGVALPMALDGDGPYAVIARHDDAVRYFASQPDAERGGHVLAERYADPKDHKPEGAPSRTRTHRAIVRPGFLTFVASAAEVIATSAVPPASGGRPDRLPRPSRRERAWFAHVVLRDLAFDGGATADALGGPGAAEVLQRQWTLANGRRTLDDAPTVHGRWVADGLGLWPLDGERAPVDLWEVLVLSFPGAAGPGEPWAAAIALRRRPFGLRYFTADRTFDGADGAPRSVLTEWRGTPFAAPHPRVVTPWAGEPSPDALAEQVRDRALAPAASSA